MPTRDRDAGQGRPKQTALVGALAVLVVALVGLVMVLRSGDDPASAPAGASDTTGSGQPSSPNSSSSNSSSSNTGSAAAVTPSVSSSPVPETTITAPIDPASLPLPADCEGRPSPFVCALAVHVDEDGKLVLPFRTQGYTADITARHIHFFFPNHPEIAADRNNAGTGGTNPAGNWILWDEPNPFGGPTAYGITDAQAIGATEICVLVADGQHRVIVDTGNCLPLPT